MNERKIFIVAGMPRVGTTFLYHYLQDHPQIALPATKELNFFSLHFDKGPAYYQSRLASARPDQWSGDISPVYFMDAEAPGRIREALPEARVILGVREPSDWVVSFHNQLLTHSRRPPRLEEMCTGFEWELEDRRIPIAISPGFVSKQIGRFAEIFGDDLLIYSFTQLRRDPLGLLNEIEKFLDVNRYFTEENFENRYINASQRKNVSWATYLLRQPAASRFIRKALPDNLIRWLRGKMESAAAPRRIERTPQDEERRETIRRILGKDDDLVTQMFEKQEVMKGTDWLAYCESVRSG